MVHDHTIPDSYYVMDGQVQLLLLQHWMQKTMTKHERPDHSHSCITTTSCLPGRASLLEPSHGQKQCQYVYPSTGIQELQSICHQSTHYSQQQRQPSHTLNKRGEHEDLECIPNYNEQLLKECLIQVNFDLQGPPLFKQQFTHKLVEGE